MDVAARSVRLRASLEGRSIDALLVTEMANVRYLTGFTGSAGQLVVTADGLTFVTDGRYGAQAEAQLSAAGVEAEIEVTNTNQKDVVQAAVAGSARLGLEADAVTWSAQRRYAQSWFPELELVATTGVVEELRRVKDPGEVDRIARACTIADDALATLLPRLGDGPTEAEFGLELDFEMRRRGADDVSFETIVAAGSNGARPHHRPSDHVISTGELVVIDFGALVDGYHSDMTRTVQVGEPSATQTRMYEVVLAAQAAGVAAVIAGRPCREVDEACRQVIDEAGWVDAFLHSTGHGVGLDIHEAPRLAATSDDVLAVGEVVTVEPGVYLADHGGVRIEDTVVVTADGCQVLTSAPKGLEL